VDEAKPFNIPKREIWEAFKRVKANQGAAGVDGQSIAEFEANLSGNLYKLWNRMSSGSYFPPPVRRVDIPKAGGGTRPLGIPTVADRCAQEVVCRYLEPVLEPVFHPDSYGYRPGKSAIDAVRQARQRCWHYDWVLDLDVKGYFDSIDWELMLKAVRHHTDCPWVLLYIERWLKAPVQMEDGSVVPRTSGTPQGGVVSPVLANLFLHYAFDMWMKRTHPHISFERYADDAICHCKSAEEAEALRSALADRFAACKLVLHPQKTKIVYCKDANRRGDFPNQSFDFLGFNFPSEENDVARSHPHARLPARRQPKGADGHQPDNPAVDASSSQRQGPAGAGPDVQPVHSRLDQLLRQLLSDEVASDPKEDRSLCHPLGAPQIQTVASPNQRGARLVCAVASGKSEALRSLAAMSWKRPNNRSRMNREVHVRFWESPGVKVLRATRPHRRFAATPRYVRCWG
jgi:RNA-directed DNA polymerase